MAKASARLRNFCFTLNNPTEEEYDSISKYLDNSTLYYIIGREVGESGTPHLQGYAELTKQSAFSTVKTALLRSHIEPRQGTAKQASDYCKKDGDFKEVGTISSQGKRTDIKTITEACIAGDVKIRHMVAESGLIKNQQGLKYAEGLMKYFERERDWYTEVYWFAGATGKGKTKEAHKFAIESMCKEYSWDRPYWAMSGKWWDGYDQHDTVVIDDFRDTFIDFTSLLRLTDRYPYKVEFKGGYRQFLAKRIIITSPYLPQECYMDIGEDKQQLLRRIKEIRYFD